MNGNGRPGLTRPCVVLALAVALGSGLLSATSALADKGGNKKPPQPPAGWEVINLQPIGDYYCSEAYGASGAQQVGVVYPCSHASLWNGTAESWVDLHPDGAGGSCAYGVSDGQQVGFTITDNAYHASRWSGTADSCVDLHPEYPSYIRHSYACGIGGGQQVGVVACYYDGDYWEHASLWTGTAGSFVDLHPGATGESVAYGVGGGQQVGSVEVWEEYAPQYRPHASLWTGTAGSWVDLNPQKGLQSCAYDVSDGRQVGYATIWSNRKRNWVTHAAMWSGKAASWVDLHPSGYVGSLGRGVSHGYQAGYAWIGYDEYWGVLSHAGMWSGTPESWVDLHALLPADYVISSAADIAVRESDIWVVGWAYNWYTEAAHAVLWHKSLSQ